LQIILITVHNNTIFTIYILYRPVNTDIVTVHNVGQEIQLEMFIKIQKSLSMVMVINFTAENNIHEIRRSMKYEVLRIDAHYCIAV